MSKTDKTRPLLLQWGDTTIPGGPNHYHGGESCDYHPSNNLYNYRLEHRLPSRWRVGQYDPKACIRSTHRYGGKWSIGNAVKLERKRRRRNIRRRERHALWQVAKSDYEDDFDLLPIREDSRTIYYDLT